MQRTYSRDLPRGLQVTSAMLGPHPLHPFLFIPSGKVSSSPWAEVALHRDVTAPQPVWTRLSGRVGSSGLELQRQPRQQHQLQQCCQHQQQQPPWASAPAHRPLPAPHSSHSYLHHRQQRCDHEPGGQLVSSFDYQSKDSVFFILSVVCLRGN